MMRHLLSTTLLSILSLNVFSQTTLTKEHNAILVGDVSKNAEIHYVEPGNSGAKQVWDFSQIKFTEKKPVVSFEPVSLGKVQGLNQANLSIVDDGYNYIMHSTENSLEELGYNNTEKSMTMVYSDPVLKMKYPFSYGDNYTDEFKGVALFNDNYKIEFTGEFSSKADAYGTLILPNVVFENVMRIKSVKNGIQVNPCGQVKVNIVKYAWYAAGHRYPVMVTNDVETTYPNSMNPEVKKTAFISDVKLDLVNNKDVIHNTGNEINTNLNSAVSVNLFPNPFTDKITYNYLLKNDMPVSIILCDVTGKYSQILAKNEAQTAGFHSGDIGGLQHELAAGVYFLRFIFGEQVVVQKFVKLEAQ